MVQRNADLVETLKGCWFASCRRPFVSDAGDMKSDGFRLSLKMKCKQVVYRSVYQNCSNYQRCKSISVGFYFLLVNCALT